MLPYFLNLCYLIVKTSPQAKRHKLSLLRLVQLSSIDNFHQQTTFTNRQLSSIDNFHQQTTFINKQISTIDNFHQQTNFIKRQLSSTDNFLQLTIFINRQLSSIDNLHPHSPESHQSSLQKASSLTRVTPVKSLEGIFTHQSHISQVFFRYPQSPE